jgi:hypothetical protein
MNVYLIIGILQDIIFVAVLPGYRHFEACAEGTERRKNLAP